MATSEAIPNHLVTPSRGKALNVGLWTVQGLLAAAFLAGGAMKLTAPIEQLQAAMPWVSGSLGGLVRFIGTVEVLGAIGLIVPSATRIQPKLTPLAALGFVIVMVLAALTHLSRGEFQALPINAVLGGLAAFVAWGRFRKAPIVARS